MLFILFALIVYLSEESLAAGSGCTTNDCHGGIMDIVPGKLPMMQLIKQNGQRHLSGL